MFIENLNGCWFATDGTESVWLADEDAKAMQQMTPAQTVGHMLKLQTLAGSERAIVRRWASRLRR
jgi:hypothetical protein